MASELTISGNRPIKFDLDRHYLANTQLQIGKQAIAKNFILFQQNPSTLVIDHWSSHGTNFLAIITRINMNGKISEHLLHFDIANADKSALGITNDIMPYVTEKYFPVPIVSDNCATMLAMDKFSSDKFFKVYCLEHKLAICKNSIHLQDKFHFIPLSSQSNKLIFQLPSCQI